jgi:hypothetical protein
MFPSLAAMIRPPLRRLAQFKGGSTGSFSHCAAKIKTLWIVRLLCDEVGTCNRVATSNEDRGNNLSHEAKYLS